MTRIRSSHSAATTDRKASRSEPACRRSRREPRDKSRLASSSAAPGAVPDRLPTAKGSTPRSARSWLSTGSTTSGRSRRALRSRSRYSGNCSRPRNKAPRASPRWLTRFSFRAMPNCSSSSASNAAPLSSSITRQPRTWCRLSINPSRSSSSPGSAQKCSSARRAWARQSAMAPLTQVRATVSWRSAISAPVAMLTCGRSTWWVRWQGETGHRAAHFTGHAGQVANAFGGRAGSCRGL
ncbi:hypothetical protein D3C76_810590 [compost metagenome]